MVLIVSKVILLFVGAPIVDFDTIRVISDNALDQFKVILIPVGAPSGSWVALGSIFLVLNKMIIRGSACFEWNLYCGKVILEEDPIFRLF